MANRAAEIADVVRDEWPGYLTLRPGPNPVRRTLFALVRGGLVPRTLTALGRGRSGRPCLSWDGAGPVVA